MIWGTRRSAMPGRTSSTPACASWRRRRGGFEAQSGNLRVVDQLEERYAEFNGLNLCFETREGILKHCSATHAASTGAVGERFPS